MESTRATRLKEASKKRRDKQKSDLRQSILEAATKLFEEKGYEDFSLRQVAEAIGYTPTTIYLYFKDKDDLLLHVAYDGFKLFGQSLQKAYQSNKSTLERFEATGWAYFDFAMSHPIHYRLMFMQRSEFLQRKLESYESIIESFGVLQRVIEEGIQENLFIPGDAKSHSALIWANVHGVVSLAFTGMFGQKEAQQLFALQMEAIRRAYCLKP